MTRSSRLIRCDFEPLLQKEPQSDTEMDGFCCFAQKLVHVTPAGSSPGTQYRERKRSSIWNCYEGSLGSSELYHEKGMCSCSTLTVYQIQSIDGTTTLLVFGFGPCVFSTNPNASSSILRPSSISSTDTVTGGAG